MVEWAAWHALLALGVFLSPLGGLAYSTWQRSKRNERKLDALLMALNVDPDAGPSYEIETDGGKEDSA